MLYMFTISSFSEATQQHKAAAFFRLKCLPGHRLTMRQELWGQDKQAR